MNDVNAVRISKKKKEKKKKECFLLLLVAAFVEVLQIQEK
jgi:hypothetical protein